VSHANGAPRIGTEGVDDEGAAATLDRLHERGATRAADDVDA
jgi:hypothetical protein